MIKKIDTVIHLAAMTGIPNCENDRQQAYDVNINGIRYLLNTAKNNKVKHFIYLNTACVFPGTNDDTMEDEDSLPYPKHYYGLTKYIAEEIAKTYDSSEMKVTIVRTNFTSMPWEYPKAFTAKLSDCEGEAAETQTWLDYCLECEYIEESDHARLQACYDKIIRQLVAMAMHPERWTY